MTQATESGIDQMTKEDKMRQAKMEIDEILRKYNLKLGVVQEVDPALTEVLKRLPSYFRAELQLSPKRSDAMDQQYFDGKFGELHKKVDDVKDQTFEAIGNINHDLTRLQVDAARCSEKKSLEMEAKIQKHERDKHNTTKMLGIVLTVIGIITGGVFLLAKLLNGGG